MTDPYPTAKPCRINRRYVLDRGSQYSFGLVVLTVLAGIGILYAAAASGVSLNVHVSANALADSVDFTTAVTGLSGVTGQVSAPADGSVSELPNPNIA